MNAEKRIITRKRSVIPACDVQFDRFKKVVEATRDVPGIGGYKVGVAFLDVGLKTVADAAKDLTDKPVIYDHQKAGTDIHESSPQAFMDAMVRAGISAVILFPQAGPITQYEWTIAAQERGLGVIIGGEMTHPRFLEGDFAEGKKGYTQLFEGLGIEEPLTGYLRANAPAEIYRLAAKMGVTDFVVPGNKPDRIRYYVSLLQRFGVVNPTFYSPGFIAQGGVISEGALAAGDSFHAIVGRGLVDASDIKRAAEDYCGQIEE
jgi:orotidine-5'-phosphate decarboxylase